MLVRPVVAGAIGYVGPTRGRDPWSIRGKGDQVKVCEYTNYCEGLDQKHKQVTCQLWDRLELDEQGVKLSRDGRRRLVAPEWKDKTAAADWSPPSGKTIQTPESQLLSRPAVFRRVKRVSRRNKAG